MSIELTAPISMWQFSDLPAWCLGAASGEQAACAATRGGGEAASGGAGAREAGPGERGCRRAGHRGVAQVSTSPAV